MVFHQYVYVYELLGDQNVRMIAYKYDIGMVFDQYEYVYVWLIRQNVKNDDHISQQDMHMAVHVLVFYLDDLDTF